MGRILYQSCNPICHFKLWISREKSGSPNVIRADCRNLVEVEFLGGKASAPVRRGPCREEKGTYIERKDAMLVLAYDRGRGGRMAFGVPWRPCNRVAPTISSLCH